MGLFLVIGLRGPKDEGIHFSPEVLNLCIFQRLMTVQKLLFMVKNIRI